MCLNGPNLSLREIPPVGASQVSSNGPPNFFDLLAGLRAAPSSESARIARDLTADGCGSRGVNNDGLLAVV